MHDPVLYIDDGVDLDGTPRAWIFQLGELLQMVREAHPIVLALQSSDPQVRGAAEQQLDAAAAHARSPDSPYRAKCAAFGFTLALCSLVRDLSAPPPSAEQQPPQPAPSPQAAQPAPQSVVGCAESQLDRSDPRWHPPGWGGCAACVQMRAA